MTKFSMHHWPKLILLTTENIKKKACSKFLIVVRTDQCSLNVKMLGSFSEGFHKVRAVPTFWERSDEVFS